MEICKLCNDDKQYKQLNSHVRLKHKMTIDEYKSKIRIRTKHSDDIGEDIKEEELPIIEEEDMATLEEKAIALTPKDIENNIFDVQTKDTERPLLSFLKEFDITEQEVRELIVSFKGGKPISVERQLKQKIDVGSTTAKQKNDLKETSSYDVYEAELLVKDYGFEVTSVTSKPRKTWFLKKT